jgi:hypothetical protein
MGVNFDLAPPPITVAGATAVPVDIGRIDASLVFDGAAAAGHGDATVDFVLGPTAGRPILDLRQSVTAVWLDGVTLDPADFALHDVGGGDHAEVRVLARHLAAGSAHILRVTYDLGPPQSSTAGSYQPALTFDAGPRVAFNFGMTDLGGGRYLEAWVPANLVFDQFALRLDVRVTGTTVAHSVITNGAVAPMAANHWTVEWPETITALSPLLEVRATDRVEKRTDSVTLPVSGRTVPIEAWKLTSSTTVDLGAQIERIKSFLAENEAYAGPYPYERFVAFLSHGAMEYEGGTTSVPSSLRHEAFHSWWARGVKPALGRDGWWDEAWTTYHDAGGSSSLPFDFTEPAVELSTRNPWSRATPGGSYQLGRRFFEGVASAVGVAGLKALMREFLAAHLDRPVTTEQIEEHLVARSGKASLVDGFAKFVYGFTPVPPAPPDLSLRDGAGDGRFWDSPELWVRRRDDGGAAHQSPEYGRDNWFHARVRNRGGQAQHFVVTFNVVGFAGTEFMYPGDFLPAVAATAEFHLAAGETRVVRARWPAEDVPPPGTHACLLAAVITPHDHPVAGAHVWEHDNLAQKNLTVVDLYPGEWFLLPALVANPLKRPRRFLLHAVQPARQRRLEVSLVHPTGSVFHPDLKRRRVDPPPAPARRRRAAAPLDVVPPPPVLTTRTAARAGRSRWLGPALEVAFGRGPRPSIPVLIGRGRQATIGLRVRVPDEAQAGERLLVDLVKVDERTGRTLGGVAAEVVVRARRR